MAEVASHALAPSNPAAAPPKPQHNGRHSHSMLARLPAFGCLPDQDLQVLLRWSAIRNLRRREVVFRQGDPGRNVILVIDGFVKLSKALEDRELVLDVVGPGTSFGEVAVLNKWPHDTDATALSRCRLLTIDGRQFTQLFERTRDGQWAIVRLLGERLRRTTEQATDALALPAPARLAKALLHLARLQASRSHDGGRIALRLSQSELGSMVGLTRESVNKHLGTWREAGWIAQSNGCVIVNDLQALSDLVGERDPACGS